MKRSPLLIVFFTVLIDLIGFGIVLPLLPFYAETFGATALWVGLLSTSYSLMQFLFAPLWGRVSDRVGRRPIILLGLLGSSLSYLIFGLAGSLPVLFFSRICAGIAGANIAAAQAYIADSTLPENRARGMGLIGAAYGLGFVFGPAIGGVLSYFGYRAPAFFAAVLAFCNFVAAQILLPESLDAKHRTAGTRQGVSLSRLRAGLRHPQLGTLLILLFISTFAFANLEATFALMTERKFQFDARLNGYLFAYIGVLITIMQGGLIGRLVKRFGERRLVALGLFVMIFGVGLLPFCPNWELLLVILLVLTVGSGVANPSLSSLISRFTGPEDQGGILGIGQSLASLARILGPAWGGFIFDRFGYHYPYLTGGAFMGVAFALSLRAVRRGIPLPQAA